MSDDGSPPAKRLRRRWEPVEFVQSTYMLRSRARRENITVEEVPLIQTKRTKKKHIEKITDLNHDCLLDIFEHTDINALCNVAETCQRFHDLARYTFRIKYSRFNFTSLLSSGYIRFSAAKKLLRNFGDLIISMELQFSIFEQKEKLNTKLLQLVERYCSKLNELKLEDFIISQETNGAFDSIANLHLDSCTVVCNDLEMPNIKVLQLVESECEYLFYKQFHRLEELQLIGCEDVYMDYLQGFFMLNPNLKRLSIIRCYHVPTKVLQSIGQLKQLEEFTFQLNSIPQTSERFQNDLTHLISLKKLKALTLNCHKMSVSQLIDGFVKEGIAIETLELANGPINDDLFANIIKLKTIKVLKLNEMTELTDVHIVGFGKQLKSLEELHIKSHANINRSCVKALLQEASKLSCLKIDAHFSLDHKIYKDLLTIVQAREPLAKLTLSIYGNGWKQFVAENERNEKWFQVNGNQNLFPFPAAHDDFFDLDEDDDFDEDELDDMEPLDLDGLEFQELF